MNGDLSIPIIFKNERIGMIDAVANKNLLEVYMYGKVEISKPYEPIHLDETFDNKVQSLMRMVCRQFESLMRRHHQ